MPLFQFITAALAGSLVVATASLVWPLVSTTPLPPALQTVRSIVLQTPAGEEVSKVLGVSDPTTTIPINVPEFVASKASEALGVAENAVRQSVTTTVITQLVTRFQQLPEDQKQTVRTVICAEPTPPVETTP